MLERQKMVARIHNQQSAPDLQDRAHKHQRRILISEKDNDHQVQSSEATGRNSNHRASILQARGHQEQINTIDQLCRNRLGF